MPKLTGSSPNEKRVSFFQDRMETTLEQLDTIWLKNKDYLTGNKISIADLLAICELEQPGNFTYFLINYFKIFFQYLGILITSN